MISLFYPFTINLPISLYLMSFLCTAYMWIIFLKIILSVFASYWYICILYISSTYWYIRTYIFNFISHFLFVLFFIIFFPSKCFLEFHFYLSAVFLSITLCIVFFVVALDITLCVCVYRHIHTYNTNTHIDVYIHTHMYMYIYTYIYTHQRSNCQHPLDHRKSKRVSEKYLFLLY